MATVTQNSTRVLNPNLAQKVMSAEEAAALIRSGDQVSISGFTGSGHPKAVLVELARRIAEANFRGQKFQVSVFTGASTGPELDGALAMAGGIHLRPYQSDPETRKRINAGETDYMGIHLSHVAQFVEYGFLGKLDVALIEVTAVLEDGRLVSEFVNRQQPDVDRPGRTSDPRSQCVATGRSRRHARHLLRFASSAEPWTKFPSSAPASVSDRRISNCGPKKSSPSCSPMPPTATARSKHLTNHRVVSPVTFWSF
jgi:hypothetical protein